MCPSVCLSVRPSVTLRYCGHTAWGSLKIITQIVRLWSSLSAAPDVIDLVSKENIPKFYVK